MKKTGKTVLSSVLTAAVCASLIASSTYALFTSESKTNIAITSGKVDVTATAELSRAFSAEWKDGAYTDKTLELTEGKATFTNGGTAGYDADSNTLSLDKISPGDGVEFNLSVQNESTIAIKYQTVVTFVNGGEVDPSEDETALYRALKISVDDDEDISSDRTTAVSAWKPVEVGGKISDIKVRIELPIEAESTLQEKSCNLIVGVYAVQGNGHDETYGNAYFVSKDSNLSEVFGELEDGDTVVLSEDVACEGDLCVEGVDATLDLNDKELTVGVDGGVVADMGASLTLTGGTITVSEESHSQEEDNYIVAYNDEGTTTTLNIDCDVDLDNVYEDAGRGYFGIWAEANTSTEKGGAEGSKAVINITEHANIHRSFADGAAVAVGANAEVNMLGGKIEVSPSENSGDTNWVASAVWLDKSGACFNLSGGEIIAKGYNVAAINMWGKDSKFCMTGGKITLDIDVDVAPKGSPASSAVEVGGDVEFSGGTIEIKSNIAEDGNAHACAFLVGGLKRIKFGKDAKIIVHKEGSDGGSDHNYSFLDYSSEKPFFDESGETATLPGEKDVPEDWNYEGTIELVRE